MNIFNPKTAKEFFIERISKCAEDFNVSLSDIEKWMLGFSVLDDVTEETTRNMDLFYKITTDEQFEAKIRQLISASYKNDITNDPSMKRKYYDAYQTLKKGDHYILVMIDATISLYLNIYGLFLWITGKK